VVVGLLGNESPDSNRFTLVTPKPENGVRLQATLGNQNPTGLPVGAVRRDIILLSEVAPATPDKRLIYRLHFDYRVRETVPMMLSKVHGFSNVR
jgi:hypothetical protein